MKLYELCNFFLKTWANRSLDWIFPPSSIFCLIILTSAGLFFPPEWSVRQGCLTIAAMISKLQVLLSFIFYFPPQGKLGHLSVIQLRALAVWMVVNSRKRHDRQDVFMKLWFCALESFLTLHLGITTWRTSSSSYLNADQEMISATFEKL